MNSPAEISTIREFLVQHLAEVFSTMLSLPAAPQAETATEEAGERVTSTVSLVGEKVSGSVYLHVPADFATDIARAMLGLPASEVPPDTDVHDVMGEVANMLAGGLKSWLCDLGAACALSTPAVIRGTAFDIVPSEGVARLRLPFACDAHLGVLEMHIKFAD